MNVPSTTSSSSTGSGSIPVNKGRPPKAEVTESVSILEVLGVREAPDWARPFEEVKRMVALVEALPSGG